uniref:Thyroglobulin type-1 domain-containing protein n=1 Tax=Parascaris univalens TaxID=6257 RepID=A0A915CGF7_PARUN
MGIGAIEYKLFADCIHLVSAIGRLPGKTLANGYIPKCSIDGRFERVQCDKVYCWCAEEANGAEIPGTKVFRDAGPPDCQSTC